MIGRFPLEIISMRYSNSFTSRPSGVCYDDVNDRVVFTLPDENKVKILNASNLTEITTINTTADPVLVVYDSNNNRYFIASDDSTTANEISTINASTYTLTSKIPSFNVRTVRGIEFDYSGDRMFISSFTENTIYIHKISDFSLITSFSVIKATGLHLDLPNNKLYVARHSDKVIDIYNATDYSFLSSIDLSNEMGECYYLKVDDIDNNKLLITDRVKKRIALLDKTTEQILGYYGTGGIMDFIDVNSNEIYGSILELIRLGIIEKFY